MWLSNQEKQYEYVLKMCFIKISLSIKPIKMLNNNKKLKMWEKKQTFSFRVWHCSKYKWIANHSGNQKNDCLTQESVL